MCQRRTGMIASLAPCFARLAISEMRYLFFVAFGLTLFLWASQVLWANQPQARPNFVSADVESDATRLEQNIGDNLGALASRPLPQLRKDLAKAIARKDAGATLNLPPRSPRPIQKTPMPGPPIRALRSRPGMMMSIRRRAPRPPISPMRRRTRSPTKRRR